MPARTTSSRSSLLRPRSVPGLLLAGFILVALPLVVAVAFAVVYVDRLAGQSERLVLQGVELTRLSRLLHNDITAMERSARQYLVLGNPALARRFAAQRREFERALAAIADLQLDVTPGWDVEALRLQARIVADAVTADPFQPDVLRARLDRFDRMRERAQAIADQGNAFIDNEVERIRSTSREARWFLLLCVFALVPTTLLLVGLFTLVISKPIRQIRRAVHRLGQGDFEQPVAISAPSVELDALGGQLDWMRRRLEALESQKNQFLQHMSHELKTPLASIREGTELLRDGTLGSLSVQQSEVVDILQRNSLELMALIENLLNFAAWRQQSGQLEREEFRLRDVAAQVAERHRLPIETRNLAVELPEPELRIHADRDRIRLILDNLVANAVKFSPVHGKIGIHGYRGHHMTLIEVTDEGPGIDQAEREHVFTPFYQTHEGVAADAHVRGTGIGLSVVREGVRAHGGDVEIVDVSGGGTCFRIRLPDGDAN